MNGDGWRLALPEGVSGRASTPAPDSPYTATSIARGWLGDHAVTIVVTKRDRRGVTLRSEARRLGGEEGDEIDVPGAQGARRVDRVIEMEEGVSPDGIERMTLVVAARRREFVLMVVRVPEGAPVSEDVEAIVASLELED